MFDNWWTKKKFLYRIPIACQTWVIPYKSTEKNTTIFFWIFDPESQKVFDILVIKNVCFLQNFGYFWPLLEVFKDFFLIFNGVKKVIFNIMFYYSFSNKKSVIPSVTGQNRFKYLLFYVFKGHFYGVTNFLLF